MRRLNTGDPCPCCGQPIALTDPSALELLTRICDMVGLPDLRGPAQKGSGYIKMNNEDLHGPVYVDIFTPEVISENRNIGSDLNNRAKVGW